MVTCWERADLLALIGDVYCIFITFPCSILAQMWYLIVSFADVCCLVYFYKHFIKYYYPLSCELLPVYLLHIFTLYGSGLLAQREGCSAAQNLGPKEKSFFLPNK